MTRRFHISGSDAPPPQAGAIIFCDGSADASFREGTDLELSHWNPNRTPAQFRADTEDVWRAPGFRFADSTNAWFYGHAPLTAAVSELREREAAEGDWTIADRLLPFRTLPGRDFPVVVSFLRDGAEPGASSLDPATVTAVLAPAFADCG